MKKLMTVLLATVMLFAMSAAAWASDDTVVVNDTAVGNGAVSAITAGGAYDDGTQTVTFGSGVTLKWALRDESIGRNGDCWWAGVKIVAPEGASPEAKYQVDGQWFVTKGDTPTWDGQEVKSFKEKSDGQENGRDYLTVWVPVQRRYFDVYAAGDDTLTHQYRFDWNADGTYDQNLTIKVTPEVTLDKSDVPVLLTNEAGDVYYGFPGLDKALELYDQVVDENGEYSYVELQQDFDVSAYTAPITLPDSITLTGGEAGHTITGNPESTDVYFNVEGKATLANLTLKDFGGAIAPGYHTGVVKIAEGNTDAEICAYNVKMENFNRAGFDIRSGFLELEDCYIDCANESTKKLTKGVLVQDAEAYIIKTTIINAKSTYDEWNTNAVETWGDSYVTLYGCTLGTKAAPVKNGVSVNAGVGETAVFIDNYPEDGTPSVYTSIKADSRVVKMQPDNGGSGIAYVEVGGGYYDGTFRINNGDVGGVGCTIAIEDGFFTAKPETAYLYPGCVAVSATSDMLGYQPGYPYTIGTVAKEITFNRGQNTPGASKLPAEMSDADKAAANAAAAGVDAEYSLAQGVTEAVKNITSTQAQKHIDGAGLTATEDNPALLVAEGYLEVAPVAYDKANTKFTVSITPKYRLYVTTAQFPEDVDFEGDDANAKMVLDNQNLTTLDDTTVTIYIPLPEGFPTENTQYYVNHKGFCYTPQVLTDEFTDITGLEFNNPDGFSDFEITTATPVAKNGTTKYTTYEAAVKDAENGDTITLLVAPTAEKPMAVNNKTVTLKAGYEVTADNTIAKLIESKAITTNGKVGEPDADGNVTITKKSSGGGGGGGGAATVDLTLTFDTNGGSAISKVTAEKGETVKLDTYKPTRDGYTFAGWYADSALTEKVTSVEMTKSMTVYAKWTEGAPVEPGKETVAGFTDVTADAYYADAVKWAVDNAVTNGDTATTFAPNKKCTRAQAVTFLWRAAGKPAADADGTFADVAADAYYADAVAWAVANGITNGMTETTFAPDVQCSRAEIVTFMARMAKSETTNADSAFTDVTAADYYSGAVAWAVENKVTTGTTAATFAPNEKCSRADIVTFLYRYLGKAE